MPRRRTPIRCAWFRRLLYACKQRGGWWVHPWFYLRLEAYCLIGSEGAYGAP